MFDLAGQVLAWQRDERPVWLARVVSLTGMGSSNPAEAVALTDGQPSAGTVLSGAADAVLAAAVTDAAVGHAARLLDVRIGDDEALAVGLTCGGQATVLVQPADDLPGAAWQLLAARTPLCLVSDLGERDLGRTTWLTVGAQADEDPVTQADEVVNLFGRGTPEAAVADIDGRRVLVTALWPTPRLVVVGEGLIAEALDAVGRLVGWEPRTVNHADEATDAVAALGPGDGVVVLSHDRAVDAPVLAAALSSGAGYVAALGSRRTQAARAGWLAEHGVQAADIGRVRGPAGLDIGARTPPEIAVAIVAEMVGVRSGATGSPLAGRDGPIHHDGLHAPPARYPAAPPAT